jgi:Tfp pilus assembly PilM family ATPase
MVMFERSVLGLDVGSQSLKAVELRISPRGLVPGQFRIHPRLDAEAPIAEHIQRFVAMHQLPTNQVACALPARQLSTRRLEFPFSDARRLTQAIPFEIEAETPFDLDDIFVDWNLIEGDRNHGSVSASLVKRVHVAEALDLLQSSGCNPHVLEAGGLVLANLAPIFRLQGSHLIADIGHEKTTFCAMQDGQPILARSIAVGGRAMTEAIASERGLSFDDAEQLKVEGGGLAAGRGAGAGADSPGVIVILDRIAREAVRTLEAAEFRQPHSPPTTNESYSTDDDARIDQSTAAKDPRSSSQSSAQNTAHHSTRITLVGGAARLAGIDAYLTSRTGCHTERLHLPTDSEHADLVAGVDPVLFGPALALALRLSGDPVTKMNFRQGEYAFRQDLRELFDRQLRPTAALAAILVVLMTLSTITTITLQHRRAGRNLDAAVQLYSEAFPNQRPAPDNPVSAMGSELRNARGRADFLGLYRGNRSALDLLAELSRTIPTDLAVRITEVNIDRNVIRLDVEAEGFEAADRLTAVLSAKHPFEAAKVAGSIKTDRKTGGVSFNVSIPLAVAGGDA